MLITREIDYALRILRALNGGKQVTAAEIASKEQIPQQFAYKILKKLKNGNLLAIQRGATGGYTLAVDLHKVSLYDLLAVMDTGKYVASCLEGDYECEWRMARDNKVCKAHVSLAAIQRTLDKELKAYSLYDILF